jgi:hypothetical protein
MSLKQISTLLLSLLGATTWAQAVLENPALNSIESGIGVISGFHCTSKNISFKINGQDIGKAGTGTSRGDTQSLCGRSDTGFSLLFNFNLLPPGQHSLGMYADGQLVETRSFNTTRSAGQEFAQGKSKTILIPDFPQAGHSARLEWVTAKQAFVVTDAGFYAAANHACELTKSLHGVWDISGVRFSLNKSKMSRMDDPQSAAPCTIVAHETSNFDTFTASYAPDLQQYMFLKYGTGSGVAYMMTPVANNPNALTGYKQSFWTNNFQFFGSPTNVSAKRISTTVRAEHHGPTINKEDMMRTTQAIGSLGR